MGRYFGECIYLYMSIREPCDARSSGQSLAQAQPALYFLWGVCGV